MTADASFDPERLLCELLTEARGAGFLGPGAVDAHLDHADSFAEAVESAWGNASPDGHRPDATPPTVVDLGSGGGVPALVLAVRWPTSRFLLVEANGRRASFLERAIAELRISTRAEVATARAETLGRDPARRGRYDVVVARLFGRPAVTAECAAPFLRVGGILVVSEPPVADTEGASRWPPAQLAALGMGESMTVGDSPHFVAVPQRIACPERFPRRVGVPAKRPLF